MSDRATPASDEDDDEVDAQRPEATPEERRRRRRIVTAVALVVVSAVAVALTLPTVSMLQPGYYARYPALDQRMLHWSTSTHSRISCIDCHVEPGAAGFFSFAVKAVPAFYSQLANGPDDTNLLKPPRAAACRKCHTTYRRVAPSGDLLIPHKAHVEVLAIECVVCHKDLVHSLNRRGFNRPEMETCVESCHDGDKASARCSDCHTHKKTPATHARADWLAVHGAKASAACDACHDWTPDYCTDCHRKRPASHAGNWKKGHGPAALRRGKGCTVCHGGEAFCKRCH